jgi:hypothetical protein
VELELITESGFPITGSQEWLEALRDVGADSLRIREAQLGEKGGISNRGTDESPQYRVVGVLTARNTLRLPGATFRMSDRAAIRGWIAKLKADGLEGLTARTGAFGLTSKQLVTVHDKLSRPVALSTKDQKAAETAAKIIESLEIKVAVDSRVRTMLSGDETVAEEFAGMSSGTALAAVLRPLGLVIVPQRPARGDVQLVVTDARSAPEVWPIGWPPEQSPGEVLPALFEFSPVEIEDFVLAEALAAIQERVKVPFLYDHNSLARHGVDPAQVKVSLPKMRTFYKRVIDRLLAQTKPQLTAEIRVDEAGQPFLWITTLNP